MTVADMTNEETINLKIIATSDVHGFFLPYDFIEQRPTPGSLARVCSYVKKERAKYGSNLILIDNGDILQGQPICNYFNSIKPQSTNIASQMLNYLGYDACTIGNHDIETGHGVYDKWAGETNCPVVAANIIDTASGKPYFKPYTMIERQGIRIAILGMVTPAVPNWLNENLWSGMRFESIADSASKWVKLIREKEAPDLTIGLFHSGWNGGISTTHCNEDEVERVAHQVEGIDVIFFGHDHTTRQATICNGDNSSVVCLNPSCDARAVASAEIKVEKAGNKISSKRITGEIVDITNERADVGFEMHFQQARDETNDFCRRRIGLIESSINTNDCFFGCAPFTDLIHNLQLAITHADISFNAPLSFNSKIEKGDIRVSDMFKLYRYENQIYVVKMTGREIKDYLEMSYGLWVGTMASDEDHIMLMEKETKAGKVRYRFKNLTFNFDSAAGIDYDVDVTKPAGERINVKCMSGGGMFDYSAWYTVAMNSYRGNGGGELLTKGAGIPTTELPRRIVWQSTKDQRQCLMEEIERMGTITPRANNNWRFVPLEWAGRAIERDRRLISGSQP